MVQVAMLAGLFLLALGLSIGGPTARVCHIAATVAFGLALVIEVVGVA